MSKTMLFNPYSGRPRDPRDIQSDPEGILIMDPDEPWYSAPKRSADVKEALKATTEYLKSMADTYAAAGMTLSRRDLMPLIEQAEAALIKEK